MSALGRFTRLLQRDVDFKLRVGDDMRGALLSSTSGGCDNVHVVGVVVTVVVVVIVCAGASSAIGVCECSGGNLKFPELWDAVLMRATG